MSRVSQFHEAEIFQRAADLSIRDVENYLRANGWTRGETAGPWMRSWEHVVRDSLPELVLLPIDPGLRDYPNRMTDLVLRLAEFECRDVEQVLDEIDASRFQVHRIRFLTGSASGTISLTAGARIHDAVRDFFLAGAVTVAYGDEPPLVHPAHKPLVAKRFLENAILAPSGVGSYVVTIRTPVRLDVPGQRGVDWGDLLFDVDDTRPSGEEPFGRRVSRKLATALKAAQDLVHDPRTALDQVDQLLDHGLSANLCEALAKLGGTGQDRAEFEIDLAAADNVRPGAADRIVRFSPAEASALKQLADDFKTRYAVAPVVLRGKVLQLDRPSRTGNGPGIVTIVGRFDGDTPKQQERHVRVHLDEADYSAATRAHDEGHGVGVHGFLVPSGTRLHVRDVRHFDVEKRRTK